MRDTSHWEQLANGYSFPEKVRPGQSLVFAAIDESWTYYDLIYDDRVSKKDLIQGLMALDIAAQRHLNPFPVLGIIQRHDVKDEESYNAALDDLDKLQAQAEDNTSTGEEE